MQVENIDKFWDPQANKGMKGPRGRRIAGAKAHALMWASLLGCYMYFSSQRSDAGRYRPLPPPCEAPPPFREALAAETTYEQPHLRRLEVETAMPGHIPQVKQSLRDLTIYTKTDLHGK